MKHLMIHSTTPLQPQSVLLLLVLASMFGLDIWTSDVRQACLQTVQVYITDPAEEFKLEPHECLQLLKPLYGLCDSGDLWHETLVKHHREDLGMIPMKLDPDLYVLIEKGVLRGLSGNYVDDLIRAGDEKFKQIPRRTHHRFEMVEYNELPFEFTGFTISQAANGMITIDQDKYLRRLEKLSADCSFREFMSMRMRLAWLANTRPDLLFEIAQLEQVTENRFNAEKRLTIKRINRTTRHAVDNRLSIKIQKLDPDSIRVVGFSDSSFANNHDLSTELGHICFLSDRTGRAVPIHFRPYKSKRVVRSAMAGKVIAFSDMPDVATALSEELSRILGRRPVQLLTDSKSLFDVISKGSRTSEKRTMLDIAAAREAFKDKVISDIGFIRSHNNLANGLTKAMSQCTLRKVLSGCILNIHQNSGSFVREHVYKTGRYCRLLGNSDIDFDLPHLYHPKTLDLITATHLQGYST